MEEEKTRHRTGHLNKSNEFWAGTEGKRPHQGQPTEQDWWPMEDHSRSSVGRAGNGPNQRDPAVGRAQGRSLRQSRVQAASSGFPSAHFNRMPTKVLPSPREPYLPAPPGRPAWPGCLSSCPPSPHVFFTPGKTKQAGDNLPLMNICHSEYAEPLPAHVPVDGFVRASQHGHSLTPHLLLQKLQGQAQKSV